MVEIDIPGFGEVRLQHLVLDVNGTVACDGRLLPGVSERLQNLDRSLELHLITADTHGRQSELDRQVGLTAHLIPREHQAEAKLDYMRALEPERVVAVGNGANDRLMLEAAAIGIAVIGPEGASSETVRSASVVVSDIHSALDLLIHSRRLVATLRA